MLPTLGTIQQLLVGDINAVVVTRLVVPLTFAPFAVKIR
jgi:hypothetical protein